MRHGSRANAITNSPFVRSLIQPVLANIPARTLSPPTSRDLLPTQPSTKNAFTIAAIAPEGGNQGQKRKREAGDEGKWGGEEEVVTTYTAHNLPEELKKYWFQRYDLFSRFDEGCRMDIEGWYSVTPELVAFQIAERCRSSVVVDAFCGVGGNAIQFAFTCEKGEQLCSVPALDPEPISPNVIAIDISPVRLACAKHNARVYGVEDRITFILADFPTWAKEYAVRKAASKVAKDDEVEVVFLSPPWGGIDYKEAGNATPSSKKLKNLTGNAIPGTPTPALPPPTAGHPQPAYPLSALAPLHGAELFSLARALTPHIAYYLPRNVDIEEVAALPKLCPRVAGEGVETVPGLERVEVEEEWMGGRLKAVTAYYGDLAHQLG